MPPPPTSESLLSHVAQQMQAVLEARPQLDPIPVQREWLRAWLATVQTVLAMLHDPLQGRQGWTLSWAFTLGLLGGYIASQALD